MTIGRTLTLPCLAIAVSAVALSCGVSSSLLSDSEKSSLYAVSLKSSEGNAIVDGSILGSGSAILVDIEKLPGAIDPAALEIWLEDGSGLIEAASRAQSPGFEPSAMASLTAAGSDARTIGAISGTIEGVTLPDSVAAGTYRIMTTVLDAEGAIQQSSEITIFIGTLAPVIVSATSFPPTVEPGEPVLLGLSVARAATEEEEDGDGDGDGDGEIGAEPEAGLGGSVWDPWIEWSINGKVFSAGSLSAGFDKTVWSSPIAAGAYSVTAQVYPAAPPNGLGFSFDAAVRQDVRVMAIASPGGSGDDFSDPLSFLCLLRLDGDFSDSGTRPRISQPEAFGSPSLDVYASGFGYRFDASAGVRIPELMPPSRDGKLGRFSAILRLDPEDGEGEIARFDSEDGDYSLAIGLDDWCPYADFFFDGMSHRSMADSDIPRSALTLEASFMPFSDPANGDRLAVAWNAEGARLGSPSIPLPPAPPEGSAIIGGPGSVPGVYDGFGLSSGPPSPAFRLASRRKWRASLVLAEGFEDGKLPAGSIPSGAASAESGSLVLDPGASLSLSANFDPGAGVIVEAATTGDRDSAMLDFTTVEGLRAFSVSGTGDVLGPSGERIASLVLGTGRLSFAISAAEDGYLVSSADPGSSDAEPFVVPGDPGELALSLRRGGGSGLLSFDSVLVRRSSALSRAK